MKKKLRSYYLKTLETGMDMQNKRSTGQNQEGGQSNAYRLYQSCDDLPLNVFISCLCDADLSGLILEGEPPVQVVDEKWFAIYSQYIDLSEQTDVKYSLRLQNEIVGLRAKMMRIDLCVRFLKLTMESGVKDIVTEDWDTNIAILRNEYNFKYSYNEHTIENDLKAVLSRSQRWDIQAQIKQAELDAYESAQKGEKPSRKYFTQILIRLSDHAGFMIRPDAITVSEFALRKKDFVNYVNSNKYGRKR